jgi:hypothetical protein
MQDYLDGPNVIARVFTSARGRQRREPERSSLEAVIGKERFC